MPDRTETFFYGHAESLCAQLDGLEKSAYSPIIGPSMAPTANIPDIKIVYTCFNDGSRVFLLCEPTTLPKKYPIVSNYCDLTPITTPQGFKSCVNVSTSKTNPIDDDNWGAYLLDTVGKEHYPAGMEASRKAVYGEASVACSDVPPRAKSGQIVVGWAFIVVTSIVLLIVAGLVICNLLRTTA